jgi:hypothetical protein
MTEVKIPLTREEISTRLREAVKGQVFSAAATITLSTGRKIPVRYIGEQHVREDLGLGINVQTTDYYKLVM